MAGLGAVNAVGDSLVALLRARRDLLAASDLLGPLPASFPIAHASLAQLAGTTLPTAGLTLTCMRIAQSEHLAPSAAPRPRALALELQYLLVVWSSTPIEEQAIMTWAMLEFAAHPVLDRSLLVGADVWERGETVQLLHDPLAEDALHRIWAGLQHRMRLSAVYRARVVRIGLGGGEDARPVVATRFGVTDADPVLEGHGA